MKLAVGVFFFGVVVAVAMLRPSFGADESAEKCFKEADQFEALAAKEDRPDTQELFEKALSKYMCAAKQGSAKGAYMAATLSLSGQAPRLSDSEIESLLRDASREIPEAAIVLADFYCGEHGFSRSDCKQPEPAKRYLIRASEMGSAQAANILG